MGKFVFFLCMHLSDGAKVKVSQDMLSVLALDSSESHFFIRCACSS